MKQQLISLFFCGVLLLQGCTEKKNEAQLEKTLSVYQVDLKSESPKESIDRFLAGMEIRLLPLESGDSILFKGYRGQNQKYNSLFNGKNRIKY